MYASPEHCLTHVVRIALQLGVDICPLLLLDELRNVVDPLSAEPGQLRTVREVSIL